MKRQTTTDGTEDIEILNIIKLEDFHAEEQCENNAESEVYADIYQIASQEKLTKKQLT